MIRVVLTGSESTGKSTLAARLAEHYHASFVPEFVRDFAARKGSAVAFDDHGPIARGQMGLEDAATTVGHDLIIQDTDLLSTAIYSAHYFGKAPPWIVKTARERRPDLYLLLEIDVPWVADPVRDRGHMREEMQQLFRDAVRDSGAPFEIIRGNWDERFAAAVRAIDAIRPVTP